MARRVSRDPLNNAELSQGPNLYAYVANDPVNHVDPSGSKTCWKKMLISFYKNSTGNHKNSLGTNDAAAANTRYVANGTKSPSTNGPAGQSYSNGTKFTVYRTNGYADNRTVNDSGKGFAEPRSDMGLPYGVKPDEWLDLYTDDANAARNRDPVWNWVSTNVGDGCMCPDGWIGD